MVEVTDAIRESQGSPKKDRRKLILQLLGYEVGASELGPRNVQWLSRVVEDNAMGTRHLHSRVSRMSDYSRTHRRNIISYSMVNSRPLKARFHMTRFYRLSYIGHVFLRHRTRCY